MVDATLLLLAMALGAIVVLAVLRLSQDESRSMRASSAEEVRLAMQSLESSARLATEAVATAAKQEQRDRQMADLTAVVGKLDVTVGNLYLAQMSSSRTVLRKEAQVGEVAPDSPGVSFPRSKAPLPPEGMVTGSSPAAEQMRQHAFAEPT